MQQGSGAYAAGLWRICSRALAHMKRSPTKRGDVAISMLFSRKCKKFAKHFEIELS